MKKSKPPLPKNTSKPKWFAAIAAALLLVVGAGAAWRLTHPPVDPQVAEVQELQKQLFAPGTNEQRGEHSNISPTRVDTADIKSTAASPASPISDAQRSDLFGQLREKMENLTEEQRRQVMEGGRDMFRAQMRETIEAYHALPKDKKAAFLDKEIDRMEERRAALKLHVGNARPPAAVLPAEEETRSDLAAPAAEEETPIDAALLAAALPAVAEETPAAAAGRAGFAT